MLKVGDTAPPIDTVGTDGKRFVLYAQESLCTVIYFFPKAFTPGCTAETKEFRKHYVEIELAGATVVGVSTDDVETQCRFASSLEAPFPMLGDKDRAICRAYDVLWPLIGLAHRVTYVVAPLTEAFHDGAASGPKPRAPSSPSTAWKVEGVFKHELDIGAHRDDVLRFIDAKFRSRRPEPRTPMKGSA
jgi:thioredoxin-dependent peroxiredoxin